MTLAIQTRNLTKQFDRHVAVHQVDLEIATGDVYGLIGPNGAGKTTLIRMLAAAEEPTLGEIYIHGEKLSNDYPNSDLKRALGYLPDDYPLYDDLNVWDYLDYFARLYSLVEPHRSQRLREVLDLVDLNHKRHSPIATLSRGMRQRLSLARTIIHSPLVLLLDEPVSGLDPLARQQFRTIIKNLQSTGMTVLISSHVLSDLAELCTSVGIMELGYLVESSPLADLYRKLSRPRITLGTVGSLAPLKALLQDHPQIEALTDLSTNRVMAYFTGNAQDQADLLRTLVTGGVPVHEFHCVQEDLETIFLRLGHQQSS